jgi:hypothetical protein
MIFFCRVSSEQTCGTRSGRPGRRAHQALPRTNQQNAWLKRRTAALNLRSLIGKGLTRQAGAWVLAT